MFGLLDAILSHPSDSFDFSPLRRDWTRYGLLTCARSHVDLTGGPLFLVVLVQKGPYEGNIAVIAEIIDHNRVRT